MHRFGMWFILLNNQWYRAGTIPSREVDTLISVGIQMIFVEDNLWLPLAIGQRHLTFEYVGLLDLPNEVQTILQIVEQARYSVD